MTNHTTPLLFNFDNSFSRLSDDFYTPLKPTPVSKPSALKLNTELAEQLLVDPAMLHTDTALSVFAGNALPSNADPLATVYAGHQFGHWNPQLGDGRAILLGEALDKKGNRFDIQLKGAGPTPYSRNGDGRAGIGPVLREYIVSEAMHAMGIPTTRALAAVLTGDVIRREQAMPGAILTRVASSHIRIGHFQFFASRENTQALRTLTTHVLERHYPEAALSDNPALALLESVMKQQAALVAAWQSIGFIHGVMNTDNMSISGETIDYGPCAFMDEYQSDKVFSSIDYHGRYAYKNQPGIAHWNLANLAQTLLPLIDSDTDKAVAMAQSTIDLFSAHYTQAYNGCFAKKLGLTDLDEDDVALLNQFLDIIEKRADDFTLTFRALSHVIGESAPTAATFTTLSQLSQQFYNEGDYAPWASQWRQRRRSDPSTDTSCTTLLDTYNPIFIPRNHQIENVIDAATVGDLEPLEQLSTTLKKPYTFQSGSASLAEPPQLSQKVLHTFCGT